jgi:hypothetical protein
VISPNLPKLSKAWVSTWHLEVKTNSLQTQCVINQAHAKTHMCLFPRRARRHFCQGMISRGDTSQSSCLPRVTCYSAGRICKRNRPVGTIGENPHSSEAEYQAIKATSRNCDYICGRTFKSCSLYLDGNLLVPSVILLLWNQIHASNLRRN